MTIPTIQQIVRVQKWCKANDHFPFHIEVTDTNLVVDYIDYNGNTNSVKLDI